MKTKYLLLGIVLVLAAGGFWFGRRAWRVQHELVTLRVRNAPLAEVLKSIEKQTRKQIRAEQGFDARITLRVTNKPLAYVLDRLAEQAGARWSTVYAVYDSQHALKSLESALSGDGKLEAVGWTRIAPPTPDFKEPGGPGAALQQGPGPQVEALPPGFAPGRTVTATEDVVARGPATAGPRGPGPMPRMVRVFRGPDRSGSTEQEVWTPEELVMESALNGRLSGTHPEDATPEVAAQAAKSVNGHWTTYFAFRRSHFGMGFGGPFLQRGQREGKIGPGGAMANVAGTNFNPGELPGPVAGDLEAAATRERNEQFARLTPEQRVERARAREEFNVNVQR